MLSTVNLFENNFSYSHITQVSAEMTRYLKCQLKKDNHGMMKMLSYFNVEMIFQTQKGKREIEKRCNQQQLHGIIHLG